MEKIQKEVDAINAEAMAGLKKKCQKRRNVSVKSAKATETAAMTEAEAADAKLRKLIDDGMNAFADACNYKEELELMKKECMTKLDKLFSEPMHKAELAVEETRSKLKADFDNNRDKLTIDGKKSYLGETGEVGYRKCPFKIVSTNGEKLNDHVEDLERIDKSFVKQKKSAASEMIIAQRENPKKMAKLEETGFTVRQDEAFIINTKKKKR